MHAENVEDNQPESHTVYLSNGLANPTKLLSANALLVNMTEIPHASEPTSLQLRLGTSSMPLIVIPQPELLQFGPRYLTKDNSVVYMRLSELLPFVHYQCSIEVNGTVIGRYDAE